MSADEVALGCGELDADQHRHEAPSAKKIETEMR